MFIEKVITCLEEDDFLRRYTSPYFSDFFAMDKYPYRKGCWTLCAYDYVFFTNVELTRDSIKVPITWKEKRRLLKAFRGAMKRLKEDRKAYLRGLRD